MDVGALLTLVVVAGLLTVLVTERIAPAPAMVSAAIVLVLVGVLTAEEAFAGFSNPALLTVAALYVVAGAVSRSGVLDRLVGLLLRDRNGANGSGRLLGAAAGASAFLNNTPIVAALAPALVEWAGRRQVPVSRYLMPLSYATILGGVVTTIGTSTNLVVSGLLVERGLEPFGLFEMSPIGLPLALGGIGLLVVAGPRLLPDRSSASEQVFASPRRYAVDLVVEPGGPVDGRSIADAALRDLDGVYLASVHRSVSTVPAAATDVLAGRDVLSFVGSVDAIVPLLDRPGLRSSAADQIEALGAGRSLVEAVVGQGSPLVGRTLKEVRFREQYGAAALAIHRDGEQIPGRLGDVALRPGDALLVLVDDGFLERWEDRDDFAVLASLDGETRTTDRRRAIVALGVLVGLVAAVTAGLVPILEGALAATLVLLATRTLTVAEARASVDLDVLLVIGGSFALGAAIEATGLATAAADAVASLAGSGRLLGVVAVIAATMLLTEPLSNAAAAAMMLPIGLDVAAALGGDPRVFAVGVAVAASASFLTPIGYQTNTMVYGLGGYRFLDYARLGAPLTLVSFAITSAGVLVLAW